MSHSNSPKFEIVSRPPFPVGSIVKNLDDGLRYRVEGYFEKISKPYMIVVDENFIKYQWRVDYE